MQDPLCRLSIFVFEVQPNLYVFNLAKVVAIFAIFWPFGAIFGVGTYLHRLTTFILEVYFYLASLKLSRMGGWVVGWLGG